MGKRKGGNVQEKSKRLKSFTVLEPGWKGIFVTCARNKEKNCRAELVPLVQEYVEKLYPNIEDERGEEESKGDIEDLIASEVAALGETNQRLVEGHLIGCECVIFIRVKKSIDPVAIVLEMCRDAYQSGDKQTRFVQKLTPVAKLVPASVENLDTFKEYIQGEFSGEKGQKFAIRASVRNSNIVKEDAIKATARLVGPDHKVDLKQYDRLILLECFKSSIGLSVVDSRYDEYGRFNLQQIYEKRVKAEAGEAQGIGAPEAGDGAEDAAKETKEPSAESESINEQIVADSVKEKQD